ncbi:angiotensin-converting enzyme [Xylocopa sonorina]|uniref:angiotensin-converting enzyme n=1 Tax=Xylocopa sonorina TaxID=1818115 RepID=UPI00403B181D
MLLKWAYIILNLVIYSIASVEIKKAKAFIHLTELDYEDSCSETANAEWTFVNSPSNKTLSLWEEKLISYAKFKTFQRNEVTNSTENSSSDSSLQYKYDITNKVGDALLDNEDLQTLVHFAGTAELLRLSTIDNGSLNNRTRNDVERILSHNNNVENKSSVWTTWHQELTPLVKNFSTILPLADKAAKANDAKDIAEYWELLSGYSNGYSNIKYEWSKIANLHKKVLKFVIVNLSQKYGITINDTIAAYLLGSLQGSDWTPIAVDVTPHPDLMYNVKKNLWKKKLIGKSMYKTASIMSKKILKQVPQADFWENSRFSQQCPSKLINFCKGAVLRVSTCFDPTISNFLSAHKNVAKVVFNQLSVEKTPVLNTANRYSALEESVTELFGILAASPAWLNYIDVMDNSTDNEQHLMISLMITALNTLPRISYYMSADMWRINAIEKGMTKPEDLISSWWMYRKEYEGLDSNETEIPTFLDDDYITSNKPYLPKLSGIMLAFQLYEYLMESTEVRYDSIVRKPININFLKMIQQGSANDWTKVINKYLEIDQISSDSLLSFFSPLEDYIDDIDEDFQHKGISAKESELDELEKTIIAEINAPPTTTTTPKSIGTKAKKSDTAPRNKQNDERNNVNTVIDSNKNLTFKSSVSISDEKSNNSTVLKSVTTTEVPLNESPFDDLEDTEPDKPKINTSKAVWALAAVLLATIIVCIIAIFGRRRCRKTPKNRRYV